MLGKYYVHDKITQFLYQLMKPKKNGPLFIPSDDRRSNVSEIQCFEIS